jgi:prepilin-type N-terminal cleavage/methylation domain-containing protein
MSLKKLLSPIFKGLKPGRTDPGFTLLELSISLLIMVVVFALLTYAYLAITRELIEEVALTDNSIEAYKAMNRMVRELRGSLMVTKAASTEVQFWISDLNSDGTFESNELVDYAWKAGTWESILRTQGATTLWVANTVYNMNLMYDSTTTTNLITIDITTTNRGLATTIESSVNLRNM